MWLVHVIPITRGSRERLTYFSGTEMPLGSLVAAPLRSKIVQGLVVDIEEIAGAKLSVKRSGFSMRKLPRQKTAVVLLPAFIRAASNLSQVSVRSLGGVLYALLPMGIIEKIPPKNLNEQSSTLKESVAFKTGEETKNAKLAFQMPRDERLVAYRSLIREEFARGKSVFLMTPTIVEGEWLYQNLSRGIEPYTTLLHSGLPKKDLLNRFVQAAYSLHPVLIIATGSFLSLPRPDVGTIIVERENSSAYRTFGRPYLDLRLAGEFLSEELHARLILADFPLSIETLWRFREHEIEEFAPLKLKLEEGSPIAIIDMRGKRSEERESQRRDFEVIGKELKEQIDYSLQKDEKLFLFCARKGIAPLTVCQDCQTPVVCALCGAPVVLHKGTAEKWAENVFVCHRCKALRSAKERCVVCRSWKLVSLGLGIERIEEWLRHAYPDARTLKLDRDSVKTHREARSVIEKFYTEPGTILLGTELALHYLDKPIHRSAVVSLDSLLSIPEWRISEKIFSLLFTLRQLCRESVLVQTRRPDDYILKCAEAGAVNDFYAAEIKLRKTYRYPPQSTLIKIASGLPLRRGGVEFERLREEVAPHTVELFELRRGRKNILSGIIRIPRSAWPDKKVLTALKELPPQFEITVNPENLFQ